MFGICIRAQVALERLSFPYEVLGGGQFWFLGETGARGKGQGLPRPQLCLPWVKGHPVFCVKLSL